MDCREFDASFVKKACRGTANHEYQPPTSARRLFSLDVLRYLLLTISRAQIRVFVKYGGTGEKKKKKKNNIEKKYLISPVRSLGERLSISNSVDIQVVRARVSTF